jgi:hypothetical protein
MTPKIKELDTLCQGFRRFALNRHEDETGNSGEGFVAVGVQFPNGRVALTWLSHLGTMAMYDTLEVVKALHGHGGKTEIVWIDCEESD